MNRTTNSEFVVYFGIVVFAIIEFFIFNFKDHLKTSRSDKYPIFRIFLKMIEGITVLQCYIRMVVSLRFRKEVF